MELRQGDAAAVLLFSQLQLARNLEGHRFFTTAGISEREQIFTELEAFRAQFFPELELVGESSQSPEKTELAIERLDAPPALRGMQGPWSEFRESGGRREIFLGCGEQIIFRTRRPGCDLLSGLEDLADWEELARDNLALAHDEHFGWLTADPELAGPGLSVQVCAFLPALFWTRRLEQTGEALAAMGFRLRSAVEEKNSALVWLENAHAFGWTEAELAARLEELASRVRTEEENALEDLAQERDAELRDAVLRSQAVLGSCCLLTREELLRRLEFCAMGARLRWLPEDRWALAALLYLSTGDAHLRAMAGEVASEADPHLDDLRASAVVKAWKDA